MTKLAETLCVVTEVPKTKLIDETVTLFNWRLYQIIIFCKSSERAKFEDIFGWDDRFMLAHVTHDRELNQSQITWIHS